MTTIPCTAAVDRPYVVRTITAVVYDRASETRTVESNDISRILRGCSLVYAVLGLDAEGIPADDRHIGYQIGRMVAGMSDADAFAFVMWAWDAARV